MDIMLRRIPKKRNRRRSILDGRRRRWAVAVLLVGSSLHPSLLLLCSAATATSDPPPPTQTSQPQQQNHLSQLLRSFFFGKPSSSPKQSDSSAHSQSWSSADNPVLLIDVDNTLYREQDILDVGGVESQIVRNIHQFCADKLNLTAAEADELHHRYGSTVEGIRQEYEQLQPQYDESSDKDKDNHVHRLLQDFYQNVYDSIDVSPLLHTQKSLAAYNTGYSSSTSVLRQKESILVRKILGSLDLSLIQLASNSPEIHVHKVIHALGLTQLFKSESQYWTPDRERHVETETDIVDANNQNLRLWGKPSPALFKSDMVYPTKKTPLAFFDSLLSATTSNDKFILIDDSKTVMAALDKVDGMQAIAVTRDQSMLQALCLALGWLDPEFRFSAERYLRCKNKVDAQSLDRKTWHAFVAEVVSLCAVKVQDSSKRKQLSKSSSQSPSLTVVDVGAGLLSMLSLMLGGNNDKNSTLPSLWKTLEEKDLLHQLSCIDYYAYEPNRELEAACTKALEDLGFDLQEQFYWDAIDQSDDHNVELVFVRQQAGHPPITVYLRFWDYERPTRKQPPSPDVIVGCCFADLVSPPSDLVRSLYRCFLSKPSHEQQQDMTGSALVYFPITFRGTTQLLPPQPLDRHSSRVIPSDTIAFALYARALEEHHEHNLDPTLLEDEMRNHGGECLSRGRSDWIIEPGNVTRAEDDDNDFLWQTMMYFFGTTACPQLQVEGYDAKAWITRARVTRPTIRASNVDLLFRAPFIGQWRPMEGGESVAASVERGSRHAKVYNEIQFTAPNTVTTIQKKKETLQGSQVRVQSICSLVSSGTELKIFKGQFDDDAALDVNLESMADQRMAYPLSYGYSLVGRIVECGPSVTDQSSLMGRLVFVFAAHASEVVVDRSALQLVPDGIFAMDAIFMPSVETALSIVHDAHVRLGEHVAVFGQGLIGLLVTALLGKHDMYAGTTAPKNLASLTTFDKFPDRLALSAAMGSSQALFPSSAAKMEPFDVAIEVSGHPRALQSAIDYTRNGGRIVIASWYGKDKTDLRLGIDFHRSHKSLQTSQVSEIPAALRASWSKQRRFDLTWELVRVLQPSRHLLTRRAKLHEAQDVYEALDAGQEVAVAFEY